MLHDADRVSRVRAIMGSIAAMTDGPGFIKIQPARWRVQEGDIEFEFETGYTNGEGRVRIYEPSTREPALSFTFTGSDGELDGFLSVIPSRHHFHFVNRRF